MDRLKVLREQMVARIFEKLGFTDVLLHRAMMKVQRHLFVDSALGDQAYLDNALPISNGQTISQPSIVAMMTHYLAPELNSKILEIGTGSGYQSAILAEYTNRLYTVERHPELSKIAQLRLHKMGYHNIVFKTGDGSLGWPAQGPFDRIIVTAGAPTTLEALQEQLAEGGRMVIPVGGREVQKLFLYEKHGGQCSETDLGDCRFVPLVGNGGWR